MPEGPCNTIAQYFSELPDPRDRNISYPLINIVMITICAVICGAESWTDVQMFGKAKQARLSMFVDLKHGIPSHDTLGGGLGHWIRQPLPSDLRHGPVKCVNG